MPSKISVIMSVYRCDNLEYLKLSVLSILQQSYRHFTFFILTDGLLSQESDDFLNSIIDNRVILIRRIDNLGLSVSLNELIDRALASENYDFFARMDADDISDPQRFETQIDFLKTNTEVDIAGSWYREIDTNGALKATIKLPTTHEQLIPFMARRSPFCHPSVMIRSHVFKQGYRYDSSYHYFQDYDLWIRLAASGFKFANIPICLLYFRIDQNFFYRRASLGRAINNSRSSIKHIRNFKLYSLRFIFIPILLFIFRLCPPAITKLAYRYFRNR